MSGQDKIMLVCTSCGRRKRVPRDPSDPPGLALMQTVCGRCDKSKATAEFYFDAQGNQIDCDGELVSRRSTWLRTVLVAMSVIVIGLVLYHVAN
jgi:predicted metal-binding protein